MNAKGTPAPPNAAQLGNQSFGFNVQQAKQFQDLNRTNQITPYGRLRYKKDGTAKFTLNPTSQALLNTERNKSLEIAKGIDTGGLDLSSSATEGRLFDLGKQRLAPQLQQQGSALEASLRNQGIMPGTAAYDRAKTQFGQQENDRWNQLFLTGHDTAVRDTQLEHNQPFQDLAALDRTGGGIKDPTWINTPQVSPPYVDQAGLAMDEYKYGPLAQWQAEEAQRMALQSGMFQVGSAALGGWGAGAFKPA